VNVSPLLAHPAASPVRPTASPVRPTASPVQWVCLAALSAALALIAPRRARAAEPPRAPVTLGVDVLLDTRPELVAGKRVGLIANQASVDGTLVPTAVRLLRDPRVQPPVRSLHLFAPEHGPWGAARAGQGVADGADPVTGAPITSLFGRHKAPTPEALAALDVLVFDLQDVGSRTYTFTTTMGLAMRAAARAGVPFVVLDRPNPLGGLLVEGPVLPKRWRSFVGFGPVPVVHGMTAGELARYYDGVMGLGCDLTVVPMRGWRRDMVWGDTGLPWVPTSPGIPHALSAYLYVATGMVGGVTKDVNEGVGTAMPFELVGTRDLDPAAAARLAAFLNAARLEGVRFRATTYRPRYGRFRKKTLSGVQLLVTDPHALRPLRTNLALWAGLALVKPKPVRLRGRGTLGRIWGDVGWFGHLRRLVWGEDRRRTGPAGTPLDPRRRDPATVERAGEAIASAVGAVEGRWTGALTGFVTRRALFLLYPPD